MVNVNGKRISTYQEHDGAANEAGGHTEAQEFEIPTSL
jgi:hypothetical protein